MQKVVWMVAVMMVVVVELAVVHVEVVVAVEVEMVRCGCQVLVCAECGKAWVGEGGTRNWRWEEEDCCGSLV